MTKKVLIRSAIAAVATLAIWVPDSEAYPLFRPRLLHLSMRK